MHPVLQSHNFLYKTSGLLGFGYNFIPILCLVGAYSISVTRTHPTGEEQLTSAERTRRSLIHSAALTYEIQEESLRGTLVGNVGRDILALVSSTSTRYTSDQTLSDQVDLTITNWRDRAVQLFHLDPASGQLRVASTPDREVLCPASSGTVAENQDNYVHLTHDKAKSTHLDDEHNVVQSHSNEISPCFVDVKIAYTLRRTKLPTEDVTTTQTVFDPGLITARIRILDINDHTPVFPQSRVSTELGELSAVPENTAIDLPTAFDPDSGENGTIGYWVADRTAGSNVPGRSYDSTTKKNLDAEFGQPNIPFRLVGDPLRLVLTRNLDWESKREYDLVVYAKDYGKPQSLTGQLSVHVTVRDENDNVPQFEQSSYTAVINESVLRGTIILELTASDADSATNGQVSPLLFSLALSRKFTFLVLPRMSFDSRICLCAIHHMNERGHIV
ncbi:Protocadherin-11 Y-linked [Fasciolopsis buskii]|uniref:Protocadherin-11 Y-linked n=1 Tax=Fasciolopsis buskii TaxID=27845 RepID=A0A8E0VE91_9TREM|nr:Protocadherin-11 Y-linked [Fasciolopsis buski]